MRGVRAIVLGVGCTGALALACEQIAHVGDYRVSEAAFAPPSICTECRAPDLRRAECPSGKVEDDAGAGNDPRYVFAFRRVSIGAQPASWTNPAYDQGMDQDCSSRAPSGLPARCTPIDVGPFDPSVFTDPRAPKVEIPVQPWVALPHGIDNALGQRVLGALVDFATTTGQDFSIDSTLSDDFNAGNIGELVVVDDWNGTPDDPNVSVRYVGSKGTENKPARWDGQDQWIPNSAVNAYTPFTSYVVGGVLVSDTRPALEDDTDISVSTADGGHATFRLQGRLMVRIGKITPTLLTITTAGRWNLDDARKQHDALVELLSQGDDTVKLILGPQLDRLLTSAADLPTSDSLPTTAPCGAISFGFTSQAERALVTNVK